MSFDWSEYLTLAQYLAGHSTTNLNKEARLRSAISRAYYAVHRRVVIFLREFEGIEIPKDGKVHKFAFERMEADQNRDRKRIGVTLNRLRKMRNKADYEDDYENLMPECNEALEIAHRALQRLNILSSNSS